MFYIFFIIAAIFISFRLRMMWEARSRVYAINDLPGGKTASIALVLGAGVGENGEASRVLKDRVMTSIDLYRAGRVQLLLMSGDNRSSHLFETDVMKKLALEQGLSPEVVLTDPQGYRTFESCQNFKKLYPNQEALIVSQAFHLDRALFICEKVGVKALGVKADQSDYSTSSKLLWQLREIPASLKAWWDTRK